MTEQTGQPIRSLQIMLRELSEIDNTIPAIVPDGIFGRDTLAAVTVFQQNNALPATGVVDLATWEAIAEANWAIRSHLSPAEPLPVQLDRWQVIEADEENLHLWAIQGALTALSIRYDNLPPPAHSGVNDADTQAAVRMLQQMGGLPETGVIDALTWKYLARLYSALGNGTLQD